MNAGHQTLLPLPLPLISLPSQVNVSLPDIKGRREILSLYLTDKPLADDVDLQVIRGGVRNEVGAAHGCSDRRGWRAGVLLRGRWVGGLEEGLVHRHAGLEGGRERVWLKRGERETREGLRRGGDWETYVEAVCSVTRVAHTATQCTLSRELYRKRG